MTLVSVILLIPFVLFLSIHFEIDLTRYWENKAAFLQNLCNQQFYNPLNTDDLSASFICGKKVTQKSHKALLQSSGIYHAIVVSGGHFLFLDLVLRTLAVPSFIRFIMLFIYYLMTGLQPPGLRCLLQIALVGLFRHFHFKANSSTLCFFSGLLCLIVSFSLWRSLSFWMSFAVSMGLCFARDFQPPKNFIHRLMLPLVFIFVFLIPFNYACGYLHPLNLILGLLFLTPFCLVLLVSAIIVFVARLFSCDYLFKLTIEIDHWLYLILQKSTVLVPEKNQGVEDLFSSWLFLLVLISLCHCLTLFYRRETIRE